MKKLQVVEKLKANCFACMVNLLKEPKCFSLLISEIYWGKKLCNLLVCPVEDGEGGGWSGRAIKITKKMK